MSVEIGSPDWARAEVRREMDILALKAGMDPRTMEIKGSAGPAQPRVKIRMPWHPDAAIEVSIGEYALQPGPTARRHAKRIARDRLIPHIRLLARDRQLEAAGIPRQIVNGAMRHIPIEERIAYPLPPWAFVMSPVALAWMRAEGRSPEWIVRQGLTNTKNHRLHSQVNGCDFEIHGAWVKRFSLDIDGGARWRDEHHQAQITTDTKLPETIKLGLRHYKGKPLRNVLSHPLLDTLPLVMDGMGRFGIAVERLPDETLAPVPEGLGQPWTTIDID